MLNKSILFILSCCLILAMASSISCSRDDTEHLLTYDLISLLHEKGGDINIKGTEIDAVIEGKTYRAIIPESFDVYTEFAVDFNRGEVTINYTEPTKSILIPILIPIVMFICGCLLGIFTAFKLQGRKYGKVSTKNKDTIDLTYTDKASGPYQTPLLTDPVCPVCHKDFASNQPSVICSECLVKHHKECWELIEGCSTFGCGKSLKHIEH